VRCAAARNTNRKARRGRLQRRPFVVITESKMRYRPNVYPIEAPYRYTREDVYSTLLFTR